MYIFILIDNVLYCFCGKCRIYMINLIVSTCASHFNMLTVILTSECIFHINSTLESTIIKYVYVYIESLNML